MRTGRCYCGSVTYEVRGELGPLVNCHCQFCRRAHGAAFATVSPLPSARFHITAGEEDLREYRNPEGSRFFCGRCGGRLFNRPRSTDELLVLVVGSLDEDPPQAPVMHINVESKAAWYEILDGKPQHESLPPEAESALDR